MIIFLLSSVDVTAVCLDDCIKGYSTFELDHLTRKIHMTNLRALNML